MRLKKAKFQISTPQKYYPFYEGNPYPTTLCKKNWGTSNTHSPNYQLINKILFHCNDASHRAFNGGDTHKV